MELTSSHKHTNNSSTCGTSSWKTNCKLAELYNQGYKKDAHIIRQDEKKIGLGLLPLGAD